MEILRAPAVLPFETLRDLDKITSNPKLENELLEFSKYINKRITFDEVLKDKRLNSCLDVQDDGLKNSEYNLHNRLHSENVMNIGLKFLKSLNWRNRVNYRVVEDYKIASLLHDIGNIFGRKDHSHKGAEMAENNLLQMVAEQSDIDFVKVKELYEKYKTSNFKNKVDLKITHVFNQIMTICYAIDTHSELQSRRMYKKKLGHLPKPLKRDMDIISAAVYFGDKFDNGKARVRDSRIGTELENEHTRVNYCVNNCDFELNEKCINLYFKLDSENLIKVYKNKNVEKYNSTEELYIKCKDQFKKELYEIYKGQFIRSRCLAKSTFKKGYKIFIIDDIYDEVAIDIASLVTDYKKDMQHSYTNNESKKLS